MTNVLEIKGKGTTAVCCAKTADFFYERTLICKERQESGSLRSNIFQIIIQRAKGGGTA